MLLGVEVANVEFGIVKGERAFLPSEPNLPMEHPRRAIPRTGKYVPGPPSEPRKRCTSMNPDKPALRCSFHGLSLMAPSAQQTSATENSRS